MEEDKNLIFQEKKEKFGANSPIWYFGELYKINENEEIIVAEVNYFIVYC